MLYLMVYFNTIDRILVINVNNMMRHAKRDHIPSFFAKPQALLPLHTLEKQLFEHIRA